MSKKTTIAPLPRYPDIVLALDLMSTTPPRFHWFLFVPDAPDASSGPSPHGGLKLHAITNGQQGEDKRWSYDRTPLSLATSPAVAAAATIGCLPPGKSVDDLDAILREIPMEVSEVDKEREPTWTCRVWIREALRRMHTSGYVVCEDVDAMEEEMWEYGREAAAKIEDDTFEIAALRVAHHSRPA
ncbi:hypothetical protein BV20DRAFT_840067 [Pilatotrama ljubarskyi]|nr:hypothetical protein BV20DRAFT_840067 [Pilatotrama ljubarskyi]